MDQLSNLQLYAIFKECKSRFAKEPDFDHVIDIVCSKLDIGASEKLLTDVRDTFNDYKTYQEKNKSLYSSKRMIEETPCLYRKNYVGKTKRPLEEVSERQQRRRLSDYIASTSSRAQDENVSPTKLYAFGLKHKYLENKKVAEVGKQMFKNNEVPSSTHIPLQIASAIFETGKMTKRIYTDIRLLLKGTGADVLPTYENLDKFRKEHRPSIQELQEPYVGIKFEYEEALKLTTAQLFKSIDLPILRNLNEVHLKVHDGLDGSGGHSIFNQKRSSETNNIIMYMFRIENIKSIDGQVIWEKPSHASSSSCRPLMLLMGKETRGNCQIVSQIQDERRNYKFTVQHFDNPVNVKVYATMSLVDGKLHSLLPGLGGAFCCLCTNSDQQCNDIECITSGFEIDRSLEQTLEICGENIHLSENRKKDDYEIRKGVTQQPITTEDITNLHPLHNLLRCFGWIYKICYHATASHFNWSEAKLSVSNRVGRALEFLKQAKEEIQTRIKEETSITLEKPDPTGHSGTSTTGNIAKSMLNTNNRYLLTQGIHNSELRSKVDNIILNMGVILAIINSSKKVKVVKFSEFCCKTSLLVKSVPWIKITQSTHFVLGHSAELIEEN